jgi:molybdenum cofactor guanylyltransferase
MGEDKALLVYHHLPQVRWVAELMAGVASPVSVSARKDQSRLPAFAGLDILCDQVEGIGPIAGLLAAFATDPVSAWLVAAVDMPWLTHATLEKLVLSRDPAMQATAYRNPWTGKPEPMCAIYEPRILPTLIRAREARRYSLMLLCDVPVSLVEPGDAREIQGINSREEYPS